MMDKAIPIDLTPTICIAPLKGIYQVEHQMQCTVCHRSDYAMTPEYVRQMLAFDEIWPCCCGQAMALVSTAKGMQVGAA